MKRYDIKKNFSFLGLDLKNAKINRLEIFLGIVIPNYEQVWRQKYEAIINEYKSQNVTVIIYNADMPTLKKTHQE